MADLESAYTRRPDLYDIEHDGDTLEGEIAFYKALAERCGGPVLELGFGTGRVGLELARAGIEVTGLDRATQMLDHALLKLSREPEEVQRRVTLLEGDMRDFKIDRKFALVYVPFRAFLHLETQDDQRACLRNVAAHLAEGGRFAGNFFKPKPSLLEASPHERLEMVHRTDDGQTYMRTYWAPGCDIHEQSKRIVFHTRRYGADGELIESRIDPLRLTWIYGREWSLLLELEGYTLEQLDGGFNGEPVSTGWEYVWVARR